MTFLHRAALLQAARALPRQGSIALDGRTLRGSVEPRGSPNFDKLNDRDAAKVLGAFATDLSLVLAHIDISEKSNESSAPPALLAELGVSRDTIVTLDALHCRKTL